MLKRQSPLLQRSQIELTQTGDFHLFRKIHPAKLASPETQEKGDISITSSAVTHARLL